MNMEERLIVAVSARPELYDSKSYYYRDRKTVKLAWREISDQLGVPVEMCQKKWKTFRDIYAKKKREELSKPGGGDGDNRPQWRFFNVLSFLDRFIVLRPPSTSQEPAENLHPGLERREEPATAERPDPEPQEPLVSSTPVAPSGSQSPGPAPFTTAAALSTSSPRPSAQKRPRVMRRLREPPSELEEALLESLRCPRSLRHAQTREHTPIEHYLLSLAPSLERLPFLDLEIVKNKISQVILDQLQNPTQ